MVVAEGRGAGRADRGCPLSEAGPVGGGDETGDRQGAGWCPGSGWYRCWLVWSSAWRRSDTPPSQRQDDGVPDQTTPTSNKTGNRGTNHRPADKGSNKKKAAAAAANEERRRQRRRQDDNAARQLATRQQQPRRRLHKQRGRRSVAVTADGGGELVLDRALVPATTRGGGRGCARGGRGRGDHVCVVAPERASDRHPEKFSGFAHHDRRRSPLTFMNRTKGSDRATWCKRNRPGTPPVLPTVSHNGL